MTKRFDLAAVLLVGGVLWGVAPATARDISQERTWCANKDGTVRPDRLISACTTVIQSGLVFGESLATSFNNRGIGYATKGDTVRAIADYDEAIKLDGQYAFAFHNRGLVYYAKKQFDRAIADYDQAIRLVPNYWPAFNDRGLAYMMKGDFGRAVVDFTEAARLDPGSPTIFINLSHAKAAAVRQSASDAALRAMEPQLDSQNIREDAYQRLRFFGETFELVRSAYVEAPDDWKLIEGAIRGLSMAPGVNSSADDESQICKEQRQTHTTETALNCFGRMFDQVKKSAGNELKEEEIIEAAIGGMMKSLDAHSSYIDPKTYDSQFSGRAGGIGLELTSDNGSIKVVSAISDTPADKAGVRADDTIMQIDGKPVVGLILAQVVAELRGAIGAPIKLTIARKGADSPIDFSVVRQPIPEPPVLWRVEDGDCGYIQFPQFSVVAAIQLKQALGDIQAKLGANKVKGYIIDLRNNSGGLLNQVLWVADLFLDKGEIVSTRARKPENAQTYSAGPEHAQTYSAGPGDVTGGKPLVVLINSRTSSGAEIVAAALQDHGRATIIGTRSFGEGSIQTVYRLGPGKGALRLTTSWFHRPSGAAIEQVGVTPDIEVPQKEAEGSKEKEQSYSQYVLPDEKDDAVLEKALNLIRGVEQNPAFPSKAKD